MFYFAAFIIWCNGTICSATTYWIVTLFTFNGNCHTVTVTFTNNLYTVVLAEVQFYACVV